MSDQEFYADPTVFDQLAAQSRSWLCERLSRLCPYGWTLGFSALSLIFLVLATAVLLTTLHGSAAGTVLAWNESLARGFLVVTGLVAGQCLLRQALSVWPAGVALPAGARVVARAIGWKPLVNRKAKTVVGKPVERRISSPQEREKVQEFFAGVRAAGVNVTIARALFSAGIRSPRQLVNARDEQLRAIHGVGPATVRKLRAHFTHHSSAR